MSQLVALAGSGSSDGQSGNRMVTAMLSNQVDEKLEPLRLTLGLTGNDFREGVFSWRGFLYYKWSMDKFWPDVMGVLREIKDHHAARRRRRPSRSVFLTSGPPQHHRDGARQRPACEQGAGDL